jgi:hypothetical protein
VAVQKNITHRNESNQKNSINPESSKQNQHQSNEQPEERKIIHEEVENISQERTEEKKQTEERIEEQGQMEEHRDQTTPSESLDQLPAEISLFVPAAESTILERSTSVESGEESKALKFLKHGVMPLLPPAKREWTGVAPITILDGPVPLTWPPADWETFTPDQKLCAWEMAATIIHAKTNINYSQTRTTSFPVIIF